MATMTLPAGSTSNDLQTAINEAASGDVIVLSSNMDFYGTVTVPQGRSIAIVSTAENPWVMIQTMAGRHFTVLGSLVLRDILLDGNFSSTGSGTRGGLLVQGSLTLSEGAIIQSCYSNEGGAVMLDGGFLRIQEGSTIEGNTAQSLGAGVYVGNGATLEMTGGRIQGNRILFDSGSGAGVCVVTGGYFEMIDGLITENVLNLTGNQGGIGGGVSVRDGEFLLSGGIISYNRSQQYGAGVGVTSGGIATVTGGLIEYNQAEAEGGGSKLSGGGFAVINGTLNLMGGTVSNNEAVYGAGIFLGYGSSVCRLNMTGGVIEENYASAYGGGIHTQNQTSSVSIQSMENSDSVPTIQGNTSSFYGGGISVYASSLTMDGGQIGNNSAESGGGIWVNATGTVTITGMTLLTDNTARGNGGGIYTGSYDYASPADLSAYQNIFTGSLTLFSGNQASQTYNPPSNAAAFANISYASTSVAASGGYLHPFNNDDINYIGPAPLVRFRVTYNANGGTGGFVDAEIDVGTLYTVLTPEETGVSRTGYTFIGWNTEPGGGGTYYEPGDQFTVGSDVELYAQWTLIEGPYDVIYDANGGTGSYDDTGIAKGTVYTVLTPEETGISRTGYTFVGWNTEPDGGGTYYEPGDQFTVDSDVELYAQWTLIEGPYDVIYDANGGTGSHGDTGIAKGTVYTVLTPEETGISRPGYTFTGWKTQPDGGGMAYQPGETIVITGNVILYAQWTLIEVPYDVIYDANGGTGSYADTGIAKGTVYTVLTATEAGISRPGYTFIGWNAQPDGGGTAYQPGETIVITGTVILYAQWIQISPELPDDMEHCHCYCVPCCCPPWGM